MPGVQSGARTWLRVVFNDKPAVLKMMDFDGKQQDRSNSPPHATGQAGNEAPQASRILRLRCRFGYHGVAPAITALPLRQRAETFAEKCAAQSRLDLDDLSPVDTRLMLHELEVHQIELELQSEDRRT